MKGGKKKGYAFIKFLTHAEAESASQAMNGFDLDGRPLKCSFGSGKSAFKDK